jgi:plastocyanin
MTLSHRLLATLAGVALVAAPGSSVAAGKTYPVTIQQMAFGTLPATLRVGDAIEWINADIFRHSATAKDKSFDVELAPKAHVRTVLKTAGAVAFYCRYHPGMTGTLRIAK